MHPCTHTSSTHSHHGVEDPLPPKACYQGLNVKPRSHDASLSTVIHQMKAQNLPSYSQIHHVIFNLLNLKPTLEQNINTPSLFLYQPPAKSRQIFWAIYIGNKHRNVSTN